MRYKAEPDLWKPIWECSPGDSQWLLGVDGATPPGICLEAERTAWISHRTVLLHFPQRSLAAFLALFLPVLVFSVHSKVQHCVNSREAVRGTCLWALSLIKVHGWTDLLTCLCLVPHPVLQNPVSDTLLGVKMNSLVLSHLASYDVILISLISGCSERTTLWSTDYVSKDYILFNIPIFVRIKI